MTPNTAVNNLFNGLLAPLDDEAVQLLASGTELYIERIVSNGHRSADGFWYDEEHHEWVVVLRGCARLRFEGALAEVELSPGDYIDIPAHQRHRVEWTTPDEPTVWLAVHYR
jgi:cupin 2 domain-containing protein